MRRAPDEAPEQRLRLPDHYRQTGMAAALAYLDENRTNAIAKHFMVGALLAGFVAFEEEWARDAESRQGFALMVHGKPVAVLPTKSIAREQRRILARVLEMHVRSIQIVPTEYVV